MSGAYAAEHADAYADVSAAGDTVIFSDDDDTVTGVALGVRGDPEMYEDLRLVELEAPMLLFVPTTYGQFPNEGMNCEWKGKDYTVVQIFMVAPDGPPILSKVLVRR
jgi:hypothetical protein